MRWEPETEAEAAYCAHLNRLEAESHELGEAAARTLQVHLEAATAALAALQRKQEAWAAWEMYRQGGPLAPESVAAVLWGAGLPAASYTVSARKDAPGVVVGNTTLDRIAPCLAAAGYRVRDGLRVRYRPVVEVTRGPELAQRMRTERGLTPPTPPNEAPSA